MSTIQYKIRSTLFYLAFTLWTIIYPTLALLIIPAIPKKKRHLILAKNWSYVSIHLCRLICGVRWEVHGIENIPKQTCVILSNHQSSWETFFLQTILTPQTQVVKKELLSVPFFGWALRAANPIAINRTAIRESIQLINNLGKQSIKNNITVSVFPEGTRNPSGQLGKFSKSGASLACSSKVDILPIAHNSGEFWPNECWIKKPGVIQVFIGSVIKTGGKTPSEANNEVRAWILSMLSPSPAKESKNN